MKRSGFTFLVALSCMLPPCLSAQSADSTASSIPRAYFFHRPDIDYGSASLRGPLGTLVDRGMSVLVFSALERDLDRIPWRAGWASVSDAVTNPGAAIERYGGWYKVLRKEFLPDRGRVWRWAWAPNYSGHIVAGGITYRFMAEWFDHRGMPAPRLAAGAMTMSMSVLNEVLENPYGSEGRSGTVFDLFVFDPLSIVVFSFDTPARFFSETLLAADWSPQAAITAPDGRVMNHGQVMSYKIPLPVVDDVRLLMLIGQGAATGVHVRVRDDYHIGAVAGFEATNRQVDPVTGMESVDAEYGGGLYLDRSNSLLASVTVGKRDYTRYAVNVYPGVLPGRLRPLGLWATQSQAGRWSIGLAYRSIGGLGTGVDLR